MSEIIQTSAATPNGAPVASPSNAAILTGAALLGGAALFATPKAARAQNKTPITFTEATFGTAANDTQVLNYALSLEALEADLYAQALQRLTTGGTNALGKTIVGLNQPNSSPAVSYLVDFGKVENAHRDFLNGALGANSILATGKPLNGTKFDFGLDDVSKYPTVASVVEQVRKAEALGVQAYLGAIPSFKTTTYLQTAAAIQGTEARHTAVVTALLNGLDGGSRPVSPTYNENDEFGKDGRDVPKMPNDVLATVRPFIVLKGEAGNP